MTKKIQLHIVKECSQSFGQIVSEYDELEDELIQMDEDTWCVEVPYEADELSCQNDIAELLARYGFMQDIDYTF